MTFNMLRNSRINQKKLAGTHIFGQYDFNKAPIAPPEQGLSHMNHQAEEELGHHMGKMDGTLDQH
jgi:hypothetical protein